ncbi:ParB/RepB/Spo0J family partition protein [Palleronia caenipelagi]|uniref:Chromosome partitioning protein ParB n=1 Tax=Palleronia caenipelagi TaxID=2489174 RepID=A0A547PW45_9RHOB|nr:ParB N-terminal domain-containing protein [Palleronia caenipelagi]TRD18367.1 chromosome partitioning protein ParB [Palleronia caenipelagi]
MAAEQIKSVTALPVEGIHVEDRLRDTSEAGVEAIMASIRDLGVMKDPIHVRKVRHQENRLVLMAGAHRLEAAKRLGWDEVPATLWTCNDAFARLMEIDDNLASAELTPLDNAVFLAERKRLYEEEFPETRAGVAGALHKNCATDMMSVAAFATTTAEKFGLSERHVRRMVSAGARITSDEARHLRQAPRPVTLADLQTIGGIPDDDRRAEVIRRMAVGEAKNASDALNAMKAEALGAMIETPDDIMFRKLAGNWRRAGMRAKRRFVAQELTELARLVAEAQAGGGSDD